MLFKLSHSKDVFEENPELKSIPEFENLTPRQMKYVILATDYKSPFRKLTRENRLYQSAVTAGYKLEPTGKRLDINGRNLVDGKVMSVVGAITKYKELQRDEDYETLLSVSTLISQIREVNAKPDKTILELEKAVALTTGKLDKLIETKKKIEDTLDLREDSPMESTEGAVEGEGTVDETQLSVLAQINKGIL